MSNGLLNAANAVYFKDSSGNKLTAKAIYFKTFQGIKVQVWPTNFYISDIYIVKLNDTGDIIDSPIHYTYDKVNEQPNVELDANSKYAVYGTIVEKISNGTEISHQNCGYTMYTVEEGQNVNGVWSTLSSESIATFSQANRRKTNQVSSNPASVAYTVFSSNDKVVDASSLDIIPYMGYPVQKGGTDLSSIGTLLDNDEVPVVLRRKQVSMVIRKSLDTTLNIGDSITLSLYKTWGINGESHVITQLSDWTFDNNIFSGSITNGNLVLTVTNVPQYNVTTVSVADPENPGVTSSTTNIVIVAPEEENAWEDLTLSNVPDPEGQYSNFKQVIRNGNQTRSIGVTYTKNGDPFNTTISPNGEAIVDTYTLPDTGSTIEIVEDNTQTHYI